MLKLLYYILACVVLFGCSSKEEKALLRTYQKNKIYHMQLQQTEKVQLKIDGITKVLLTATYLPKKKSKSNEVFIIGFYAEDKILQDVTKEGFSLTLDGMQIRNIKKLNADSHYLKDISFKSEWNTFYLVEFPHTSKKNFHLILRSDIYGTGTLNFAKVAKYVLSKTGF